MLEAVRECGFPEVADQVEQSFSKNPGVCTLTGCLREGGIGHSPEVIGQCVILVLPGEVDQLIWF